MLDLRPFIRPGDGIWWSQAGAEATPLVDAMLDRLPELGPLRAFCGLTLNARLREIPDGLALSSYGAMGELRRAKWLDILPVHYSQLPRLFAEHRLPGDVGLVQVAPPDSAGLCSLGVGVDYAADAAPHSHILIAEINHRMPRTVGTPGIPVERFAATIETDRPLAESPERAPDAVDQAIAARVADLVTDGDTVQMGVGSLPAAVVDGLAGHRDLGFHAGMVTGAVLDLIDKGVLTGARKEIDTGVAVTGQAVGGNELYTRLDGMPVVFRPASYTHDPGVLGRLRRLVAINAAIQVDLSGQVGSEAVRGRHIGGIGGQGDFCGAAARTGALSIIALRAVAAGASTIVPALDGPVSTARADVDVVVTEHGTAWMRGCPTAERGTRLAAVAAPEHRDELLRALREGRTP